MATSEPASEQPKSESLSPVPQSKADQPKSEGLSPDISSVSENKTDQPISTPSPLKSDENSIVEQPKSDNLPSNDSLSINKAEESEPDVSQVQVEVEARASFLNRRIYDSLLLFGILVMLAWPLLYFGVVFGRKGIQMNNHLAKVVTKHPQSTAFFVTFIGNIVCLIVDVFFSFAVIRLAQEWITKNDLTVYHVSLLSGFKNQTWPWSLKDLKEVFVRNRWLPAVLLGVCIGAFTFIPSSVTSLLTPIPFNRTVALEGTEVNFSPTATDCLEWLNGRFISNNCDWRTYKGMNYTTCLGENQMVDVLESGRGNILSLLLNNSESLTLSQLGAKDGLHFLGSIRGVLPIGPNGVPALDTLLPSPLSDPQARDAMLSYLYTLDLQGLVSNINCTYDTTSPIAFWPLTVSTPWAIQYNGTCGGKADVLTNVLTVVIPNGNSTLGFWACKSPPNGSEEPAYFVYLRGRSFYGAAIGNITCTVSPIKPAIFPVTYQSGTRIFSLEEQTSVSSATFPRLIERTLMALASIIQTSQNYQTNFVAESVITFGVKSFGLPPYIQNPQYLRLYEAMIQGMLEYQASYSRLIYSTAIELPPSCHRTVNGTVIYEVIGWHTTVDHIGYLAPMLFVNLASLIVIIIAMHRASGHASADDPTNPKILLVAIRDPEGKEPNEMTDKVVFRRRDAFKQAFDKLTEKLELPPVADMFSSG